MCRNIIISEMHDDSFVRLDLQALAAGMAAMQAAASAAPPLQRAAPELLNDDAMPHLADRQRKHLLQLDLQPAAVPSLLGSALPSPSYEGLPFAIPAGCLTGL
jgi:hypothetical protein